MNKKFSLFEWFVILCLVGIVCFSIAMAISFISTYQLYSDMYNLATEEAIQNSYVVLRDSSIVIIVSMFLITALVLVYFAVFFYSHFKKNKFPLLLFISLLYASASIFFISQFIYVLIIYCSGWQTSLLNGIAPLFVCIFSTPLFIWYLIIHRKRPVNP